MEMEYDWKSVLEDANKDLEKNGYSLLITEPEEEGLFNCEIWLNGEFVETYAYNYYENELEDLITDACAYVSYNKPGYTEPEKSYSRAAKKMVAEQIIGMLENNVLRDCGMESFMGWLEDGDAFYNTEYAENYTDEQIAEAIQLSVEIAPMVDELSWKLAIENEG